MSVWTKLFGANEIIEMTRDGVDAAIFTQEERAKHYLDVLKVIEPFKIAQRWLMVLMTVPYLLIHGLSFCLAFGTVFLASDHATHVLGVADLIFERNNDTLGLPVALINAFYFAGGAFEGIISKFKK